jgi:hypothetical protein
LRCGEGDREPRAGDRVAERGVTERTGDLECAERGRLGERVRDGSRDTLRERERVAERTGDALRVAIFEYYPNLQVNKGVL